MLKMAGFSKDICYWLYILASGSRANKRRVVFTSESG